MKLKHNTTIFSILVLIIFFFNNIIAQSLGTGTYCFHTIIANSDGTVSSWGENEDGQLGNGNNTDSNEPVIVDMSGVLSGKTITAVAAGRYHSLALASDGIVYAWGGNRYGQLGNGNNINSNVPIAVDTSGVLLGKTITAIAVGSEFSLALTSDGTVYSWGSNNLGQLGNGSTTNTNVPVMAVTNGVLSGKTISAISAGLYHSIALSSDGMIYSWGHNFNGQLGNGNNNNSNVPVTVNMSGVLSGKTITGITSGGAHVLALDSDGKVYSWGGNYSGQLGIGDNTNSNVPVIVDASDVLSGKTLTTIAAGYQHSLAVDSDGNVYSWGKNSSGQLGNGNTTDNNIPVQVNSSGSLSGKTIIAIATGKYHSIALDSEGGIYTWGYNIDGQLGDGSNTRRTTPVLSNYNSALPVELTTFTASNIENKKVQLNWSTATEVNNYGFQVERRKGIGEWKEINFIEGSGNSNSPKHYEYVDENVSGGKYSYRLKQIDIDGNFGFSKFVEVELGLPVEYKLSQNYPNPFNPTTQIQYTLPNNESVTLKIYNLLGSEVATLVNQNQPAGSYEINFDASNLTSGIYFYQISAGNFNQVRKMMLVK